MTRKVSAFPAQTPVARKPVKTTAEAFFAERKGRGDPEAAISFLTRSGGEVPRAGDEMPD